jgi:uncharacterized protein YjbI with pentapeptide repeats
MTQPKSFQPPHLPKQLHTDLIKSIEDRGEYAALSISGSDLARQAATGVLFEQVRFRRVILNQTQLVKVRVFDARFEACDLSAADWEKAGLRRVEFVDCRLLGIQLPEAQLDDVLFKDCNAEEAVFVSAAFRAARFDQCNLRRASFEEADLTGVVFRQCDLTEANLCGAKLNGADLRGSNINGVRVGARELQGAIIDSTQAIQVTSLLGLVVRETDESSSEE